MKASDFEEAVAIVNSIYEEINGASVMITGDADSDKKK
jgi:hypothetical protein